MKILKSLDAATIKKIISDDFPDLNIDKVNLITSGWDNVVAEIDGKYIFRFPKDIEQDIDLIEKKFYRELGIIKYLKDKVTINIPVIKYVGKSHIYMGYKKITGAKLTLDKYESLSGDENNRLVSDLANFLHAVHDSLSIEQAQGMGIEAEEMGTYLNLIKDKLLGRIDDRQILEFIKNTCEEFEALNATQDPVVLYNDLHMDNIAFDYVANKVNGIFDFTDVMIGDRHLDFHPLYNFDSHLMKSVVEKYEELTSIKLNLRRIVIAGRIADLSDLAEYIDEPKSEAYQNVMKHIQIWLKEVDIFKNH